MDLLVEDLVVVEIKAIDGLLPIHRAQLLTYLRASGKQVGLLINFNVAVLKDVIKRLVNGYSFSPRNLSVLSGSAVSLLPTPTKETV